MKRPTRAIAAGAGLAIALAVLAAGPPPAVRGATETNALPGFPAAGLPAQVRYIGRDPATGLANAVNDRVIAEVERSYEEYDVEDRVPVPPPPAAGPDVVAIAIPAINVDAPVARLGLDAAGRLDVPQDSSTVGWNPGFTALPGTGRSTFFAAHYVFGDAPGVFFHLADLVPGDLVQVTRSDAELLRYRVISVVDYPLESIDMGAILAGPEGSESLALMTCSGPGDGGSYPLRTLVLAVAAD